MKTIFRNKYCTLYFIAEESLMHLVWQNQPDMKSLLSTYNKGIDFAIEYQAKNWIADNQRGVCFDVSMQRALSELSANRMQETTISRFARVVPSDVFHELVSHKMLFTINQLVCNKIQFELFNNMEDARSWILQENSMKAMA